MNNKLKKFLNQKLIEYNTPAFIMSDPISVPHLFTQKQDIEIAGFFTAIFSWGNRTTIINKAKELMQLMNNAPYQFITQHQQKDLAPLIHFKHRTFNTIDLLYFITFLKYHYTQHNSLENAFNQWLKPQDQTVEKALIGFHQYFFSLSDTNIRTKKHIATPKQGSTCKRLNMFLRWMVRQDNCGVDFGLWEAIKPSQLICPIDVHVARVAQHLGIISSKQINWHTAVELTWQLKQMDSFDPVKYDFVLFGLGVDQKLNI